MSKSQVVRFHKIGGPEVLILESAEVPRPSPSEATIQNHAIGINYIDTYFRSGLYATALPSGLGFEGAGVVQEVGAEVTHIRPGDRVAYAHGPIGAYAERRTMPAWQLVKIPESVSFDIAAAIMLKGLTVQYLFRQTYIVVKDEIILFHAGAGGVGLLACQWARHLGVKLIATVSSTEKAEIAKSHGAWATIDYTKEDVAKRVQDLTDGKKVSVVYDGVGKDTWELSLECLRPRGLMVSFGNASGAVKGVNLGILAQKGSLYVTRPTLFAYNDTPEKLNTSSQELLSLVNRGALKIEVNQKFSLGDVVHAHQTLESRQRVGSLILIPE